MEMSVTKNLRAFPSEPFAEPERSGMSLRDYFAGQALGNPAICTGSAPEWRLKAWFGDRAGIRPEEIVAKQARAYADAMLTELALTKPHEER